MPTIAVDREDLFAVLGRAYSEKDLDELCFDYGLELDEWLEEPGERPQVKIEVPANRYDMLCLEGIARALAIYLGKQQPPQYKVVVPENPLVLTVEPEVAQVRPFAAAAVLRGVKFTQRRYDSFIALQDKLHANLARNRSLVAIGTHDLRKVKGNLRYRGVPPQDIHFAPLNTDKVMSGPEIIEYFKQSRHLARYVPLIESAPVYPLFVDEADTVLSLPPLINSEHTKITLETTDIFFDLTATDETKLEIVVNEIVAMFSEYAAEPFTIEAVRVEYADGSHKPRLWPNMEPTTMTAEVGYLNAVLGLDKTTSDYKALLHKMALAVDPASDEKTLHLQIPVTRPDILHQADIVEDAGIGYGFNNLKRSFPNRSATIGEPLPINKVSDILRREAAQAGWLEVMPLTLSSIDENFNWMRVADDGTAVHLENPKTAEYQVVRTTLLPGLLKTIRENRKHSLPIKVFESGEVAFKDTSLERASYNGRHFAAIIAGKTSGFEIVQGLLDRLFQMLRYTPHGEERGYWLEEASEKDLPSFFPGRAAKILVRHKKGSKPNVVGKIGVLHPEVLEKFQLPFVCSGFEFNVREFL